MAVGDIPDSTTTGRSAVTSRCGNLRDRRARPLCYPSEATALSEVSEDAEAVARFGVWGER